MNTNNVHLENCADEPIHIPGLIQPHGFLIAINRQTFICEICSQNINEVANLNIENILTKHVKEVFDEELYSSLKSTQSKTIDGASTITKKVADKDFLITYFLDAEHFVLEFEPAERYKSEHIDLYRSSSQLLNAMESTQTLLELADVVTKTVRDLTGYDRVMIYRFDEEYNGEVIAEAKAEKLDSYLGLHYPHTDIPAQARELYLRNQLRVVCDVHYCAVPLLAQESIGISNLDLSLSSLRSVSPIHIEYLKNMGVNATLTVSLVHQGRLWGLIACHHGQPKYLSQSMKSAVKLQGHFITSQIDVRIQNEQYEVSVETNRCIDQLLDKDLMMTRESFGDLYKDTAIIGLCNSIGAIALVGNRLHKFGHTPTDEVVRYLSQYLHMTSSTNIVSTDSISKIISNLPDSAQDFPGVIFHSLGNEDDCLMWFRRETITEVAWAGAPSKTASGLGALSPRKSFAMWSEAVKGRSKTWLNAEIKAAQSFVNFFQVHFRTVLLNEEKEEQRKLTDMLRETNAELENINWISTHDLQEPLRKIRVMSSIMVNDKDQAIPDAMMSKIVKVQDSAERMQNLILDILKYTKASNQDDSFIEVDLNFTLEEIREDLSDVLVEKGINLSIGDLPNVAGVPFLLSQVFSNLLYNAVKFSDTEKCSIIDVSSSSGSPNKDDRSESHHKITISDNGIGFDNEYGEKIFKIFSRLHSVHEYSGSGVGLALCKKILLKHQAVITAIGEPGVGATFCLYFPKKLSAGKVD